MAKNKIILLSILTVTIGAFAFLLLINKKNEKEARITPPDAKELLIREHNFVKGSPDAKVTIVEFLDPECEACRAMHPVIKKLLTEYDGKVRFVIRYMPLHGNSRYAAAALEEARAHGKYEEALDLFFEKQPDWGDHHNPRADLIIPMIREVGVTGELSYASLIESHGKTIDMDEADGRALGVRFTPTFIVNGVQLSEIGYEPIKQAIDGALQAAGN